MDGGDEVVVGCVGVEAVADGTVGVVYCVWGSGEDEGLRDWGCCRWEEEGGCCEGEAWENREEKEKVGVIEGESHWCRCLLWL